MTFLFSTTMGRHINEKSAKIRKYFIVENNYSNCKLCIGGKPVPGSHNGNLAKHLKAKHPAVIAEILKSINADNKSPNSNFNKSEVNSVVSPFVCQKV